MRAKQFITEGLNQDRAEQVIRKFVDFAANELDLKELPEITLHRDNKRSQENRSFGGYGGDIHVTMTNRHLMDVCRTLAHEMVHFKQDLEGRIEPDSGGDGTPIENEANAVAAVIMRKWGKLHPSLFGTPAIE